MRAGLLLLSGTLLLAGVGCGPSAAQKAELAALQGRWRLVSADLDQGGAQVYYTITGDKMRIEMTDSVGKTIEMDKFRLRLNPNSSPKQVDLENIGPNGEDLTRWQQTGRPTITGRRRGPYVKIEPLTASIYKLEGDTLTICVGSDKNNRPATFDLDAFPRSMVLKRVPPGE